MNEAIKPDISLKIRMKLEEGISNSSQHMIKIKADTTTTIVKVKPEILNGVTKLA